MLDEYPKPCLQTLTEVGLQSTLQAAAQPVYLTNQIVLTMLDYAYQEH